MTEEKGRIGVFDSGFGGLSILRGIRSHLPQYDYVYFGDSARAPYGDRSPEAIYAFTKEAVDFLFKKGAEIIILACNTASSDALAKLQQEYIPRYYPDKNILGVLIPAAEDAVLKTKSKRIGVLSTRATALARSFPREISKLDGNIEVFSQPCPLLVPIIEEGQDETKGMEYFLQSYLSFFDNEPIDTVILGCTHYGLIKEKIAAHFGVGVCVISEEEVVPPKMKEYLNRHSEYETKLSSNGTVQFFSSDKTDKFERLGERFYGEKIEVEYVNLQD